LKLLLLNATETAKHRALFLLRHIHEDCEKTGYTLVKPKTVREELKLKQGTKGLSSCLGQGDH